MSERTYLEMLGYCALWALFAGLCDFVHQYGLSQMWYSDIHSVYSSLLFLFFLDYLVCTTILGFGSYHHIPAEYLVLLPIQKTGCTGSASLELFWFGFFLYSQDKLRYDIEMPKMPVYNQGACFVSIDSSILDCLNVVRN